MPPRPIQQYRPLTVRAVLLPTASFAISFVVTACLSPPKPHVVVHEDPRGSVYLEAMPDGSFQATHPIPLDPALVARVLRGLQVQEQQRLLQTLVTGASIPVRAFSDEDTEFLASHIATALSQATALQLVGFRVLHTTGAGTETTGGELYLDGHSLHVSLTHYRYNPEKPSPDSKPGRQLPDSTGLDQRHVLFIPEAALRSAAEDQPDGLHESHQKPLIIDYNVLAHLPDPQSAFQVPRQVLSGATNQGLAPIPKTNGGTSSAQDAIASPAEELRSLKELVLKQATELRELKKELEALRHQRSDRDVDAPKPKPSKKPVPRGQRAPP